MKLKSIEDYTVNRSFILPIVGKITFDNNNCIEVSEQDGEKLLGMILGIKLQNANEIHKVSQNDLSEAKSVINFNNMSDSEIDELLAMFPEDKTKKLTSKEKKVKFLEKNYN